MLVRTLSSVKMKKLLPIFYISGLILGLVLTLLYTIYPSLVVCSSLFGEDFCTPAGLFLGGILSLPGYLIVGNVLQFLPAQPIALSLIFVLVITAVTYYLLGLLIDKLKMAKRSWVSKSSKITTFVLSSFIVLLILYLILLARTVSLGI